MSNWVQNIPLHSNNDHMEYRNVTILTTKMIKILVTIEFTRKKIWQCAHTNMKTRVVYKLEILEHFAPCGIFGFGSIRIFWIKSIRQEKLSKFRKILNYNKS